MNSYSLFPTLVCDFQYEFKDEFKDVFYKNMSLFVDDKGEQGEAGIIDLQMHDFMRPFYSFVATSAKQYVGELGVDPDEYVYVIVKSWWNALNKSDLQMHTHSDAHLSFVYYVNVPPKSSELLFKAPQPYANDLTGGLFMSDYNDKEAIKQTTPYTPASGFKAEEGKLLIFPSTIDHMTVHTNFKSIMNPGDDELSTDLKILQSRRISIAGDFIMTFKNPTSKALGIQPIEKWIRFS